MSVPAAELTPPLANIAPPDNAGEIASGFGVELLYGVFNSTEKERCLSESSSGLLLVEASAVCLWQSV